MGNRRLTQGEKAFDKQLNILVISLSGMGDVLLFTPALHVLRQELSNARITMLVKSKAAAQVLAGNPDIDHIQIFDPKNLSILNLVSD